MLINIKDYLNEDELKAYEGFKEDSSRAIFFGDKVVKHNFNILVDVLKYRDIGEFHKKEIDNIAKSKDLSGSIRRLWLWARGHFKTSLITEAHIIYLILNNLNIRILIVSNTLEIAKTMLRNVKAHFISNADFRLFFPQFCPKANQEGKIEFGTTENFIVPNRIKFYKEPTVMVAGVGTNLTGLHFDYMKIDDLVTKDSVANDTQIQASKDYYASLRQLFDNPTIPREDVVGTTYHFSDLYANILKSSEFEKSIIPAKTDIGVTFPERFSAEGLDGILNDPNVGPYEFNAQYMLNPINPADAKFKGEWWKEYDTVPDGVAEYICVDPASTIKKKSDYTVMQRWGIDWEGKHYLKEGIRDKLTVFQRIDAITDMAKRCKRLVMVKYEVIGGRHGDLESLKKRFLDEKLHIEPTETKSTTSSKKDRIEQRLVGQFHAGMILMPQTLTYRSIYDGKVKDFIQEYKLEFLQFPYSEHDDILDCHSQMFDEPTLMSKGLKPQEEKIKYEGTAQWWDDMYGMIDREQGLNPFMSREQAINRLKAKRFRRLLKI